MTHQKVFIKTFINGYNIANCWQARASGRSPRELTKGPAWPPRHHHWQGEDFHLKCIHIFLGRRLCIRVPKRCCKRGVNRLMCLLAFYNIMYFHSCNKIFVHWAIFSTFFQVAASHDSSHIVAVTSNNMVCIWKQVTGDDDSTAGSDG